MHWTILWFQNQVNEWTKHSETEEESLPAGHKAYAVKQQKIWKEFHKKTSERFAVYI
jgi:hypothetical protein